MSIRRSDRQITGRLQTDTKTRNVGRVIKDRFNYFYVSKSGSDSNDGSQASPWLTIDHALANITATKKTVLYIGDGTYAEDSGSGYLSLAGRNYTNLLIVCSETGNPDNVIIKGVSGNYSILGNNQSNILFKDITIQAHTAGQSYICRLQATTKLQNVSFDNVIFDYTNVNADASDYCFGVDTGTPTGAVILRNCSFNNTIGVGTVFSKGNIIFENCSFECGTRSMLIQDGTLSVTARYCTFTTATTTDVIDQRVSTGNIALYFNKVTFNQTGTGTCMDLQGGTSGTGTITGYLKNSTITSSGSGFSVDEYADFDVIDNSFDCVGPMCIAMGSDSAATGTVTGSITGNSITGNGVGLHPILLGRQSDGVLVDSNTSDGRNANYAIVIKGGDATDHTVTNNTFYGGSVSGLLFKGTIGATVTDNVIYQSVSGGDAIDMRVGGLSNEFNADNITLTGNTFYVTDGNLYSLTTGEVGDNNVVDENNYSVTGSGAWGAMFGTAVSSLSDVRTVWDSYAITTNDDNSVDIS